MAVCKHLTTKTKLAAAPLLVEASDDLLSQASGHNSGIACTGVDAAHGSIERALVRDSIASMRLHLKRFNLPYRPVGSLVVDTEGDDESLRKVKQQSHDAGDTDVELLSGSQALELEPSLDPNVKGAVHIKGEVVVDPFLIPMSYASHAVDNGAEIRTGFRVESAEFSDGKWRVTSSSGEELTSRIVISCVGNFADILFAKLKGSPAPFVNKPRKGQYCIFSKSSLLTRPLQPVPTSFTKGVFVFSTLYGNIVAGPTAEEQEDRVVAECEEETQAMLRDTAYSRVSALKGQAEVVRSYAGLRPATTERDYQFQLDFKRQFLSVASIRSTGLTAR